ncbi:hypothetical protein F4810DRAFT_228974 [Camillea tinctor]|nr:hypothetical protein F4810DRAFT_228974 [Camillea tinctor]
MSENEKQEATSPHIPELAHLAACQPEEFRRRASTIEDLAFFTDKDAAHHGIFLGVPLPRLSSISLDASDANTEAALEPYLQPSLRRFCLYGGPVSDEFLDKLRESCPSLEHFLLDNARNLISAAGLLRFVSGSLPLKHIELMYGLDYALTPAVLRALARRPGLETLKVGGLLTHDTITSISSSNDDNTTEPPTRSSTTTEKQPIFPDLRTLCCSVIEPDMLFTGLLPHLPSALGELEVVISRNKSSSSARNAAYKIAPNLTLLAAHCPDLHTLKLRCRFGIRVSRGDIARFVAKLPRLEVLDISEDRKNDECGANEEEDDKDDKEEDEWEDMDSPPPLTSLRILRLTVRGPTTPISLLEAASRWGSDLVECELLFRGAEYDLRDPFYQGEMPVLRELEVERLVKPRAGEEMETAAREAAQAIERIAPRLESFRVRTASTFANMVESIWEEISWERR